MAEQDNETEVTRPASDHRRKFLAGTAVAGATAWAVPKVASAQIPGPEVSGPPRTTDPPPTDPPPTDPPPTEPPPPPPTTCDLRTWIETRTGGNWDVAPDGSSLFQRINTPSIAYYVSPDVLTSFTFDLFLESEGGDDDFIGFLFGYSNPTGPADPEHDYLTLSWKGRNQCTAIEGMVVRRVLGIPSREDDACASPFWDHQTNFPPVFETLGTLQGDGEGYVINKQYAFRLRYTTGPGGNLQVFRKETTTENVFPTMTDSDKVFDIDGNFPPGRIGFYNLSQASVRYIQANCAPPP